VPFVDASSWVPATGIPVTTTLWNTETKDKTNPNLRHLFPMMPKLPIL
jgi:hypothetical protein